MIGGTGSQIDGAAYGPLPTFTQTAGSSEVYAAYMALRLSKPPVIISADYEQLVTGWETGSGTFTQASSRGGEAWTLLGVRRRIRARQHSGAQSRSAQGIQGCH